MEQLAHACWWHWKTVQPFWKGVWQFLINFTIYSPHEPAALLLGIYPWEIRICVRKTCAHICMTTACVTAEHRKHLKPPSPGERLPAPGQPRHGNDSAMTKTMLPTPATTRTRLQHITLSERGRFQEVTHCMVPFTAKWLSQAGKALVMENGSWLLGWRRRGRFSCKGQREQEGVSEVRGLLCTVTENVCTNLHRVGTPCTPSYWKMI